MWIDAVCEPIIVGASNPSPASASDIKRSCMWTMSRLYGSSVVGIWDGPGFSCRIYALAAITGNREMMHLIVTSINAVTVEGRVMSCTGEHRDSRRPLQSECSDRIKALLFFVIPCIH